MQTRPTSSAPYPALRGAEGELVSISITIEPRLLEQLLDALAGLDFPINPQIYHQAAVVYMYADGHQQVRPVTMVEFPAYASRLAEVRRVVEKLGLPPDALVHKPVLECLHGGFIASPAPPGATYVMAVRYRQWREAAAQTAAATQ